MIAAIAALGIVLAAGAALAQPCPSGSELVSEERAGHVVRRYCQCRPGFELIGRDCVPSTDDAIGAQNRYRRGRPAEWLADVQAAVRARRDVSGRPIAEAIRTLTSYTLRVTDLEPGDVLLVAPADPLGELIDLLTGRRGASHALTVVGRSPSGLLFLDHIAFDPRRPEHGGGSEIIGEPDLRARYGRRALQAVRPKDPVEGRRLLREALDAAARDARPGGWKSFRPTSYSLGGATEQSAACSVRDAMLVFKATGATPEEIQRRLAGMGIQDLSPNSFLDPDRLGKYFVAVPVE